MNFYSFYTGKAFDAHQWLGVHPRTAAVFSAPLPRVQKEFR